MSSASLEAFARQKLGSLERRSLKREIRETDRCGGVIVERDGRRFVSFSCNDYLGLATDPATIAAAVAATGKHGTGAGASRLITGSHSGYRELERKLAALKDSEDAVVFGSGYLANIGLVPLFAGPRDLVLIDELAHSCLLSGASLGGGTVVTFPHNDVEAVAKTLGMRRAAHRHCLILTEGVFSMDGDLAPLPALAAQAADHDAWLMSDDAHALGVVGGGRGSSFAHGKPVAVPLQMGTLSKAVGAYGGYLCASRAVCDLVRNRARSFVYSTGLPPGTVAAAAKAIDIIASDSTRVSRPLTLARRFTQALRLPEAQSPVVPLVIGANEAALEASRALEESGLLVVAIRPPTVPPGTARLRLAFSAAHSDQDVAELITAVRGLGRIRR